MLLIKFHKTVCNPDGSVHGLIRRRTLKDLLNVTVVEAGAEDCDEYCFLCRSELVESDGTEKPILVLPCGHKLCADCMEDWTRNNAKCFVCNAIPAFGRFVSHDLVKFIHRDIYIRRIRTPFVILWAFFCCECLVMKGWSRRW